MRCALSRPGTSIVSDPRHLKRNIGGARSGDALILGKPLGVGIYSAALQKQQLPDGAYAAMLASALRAEGFASTKVIGSISDGPPRVEVV